MVEHLKAAAKPLNMDFSISILMQVFILYEFFSNPDLSSLFNWNTKQVFAYLVAEYSSPKYVSPGSLSTKS